MNKILRAAVILMLMVIPLRAQWVRAYGGTEKDIAHCIFPTDDGGFIMAVESLGVVVLKLFHDGTLEWQKYFNVVINSEIQDMVSRPGGGYIAAGRLRNTFAIIGLTAAGEIEWCRSFVPRNGSSQSRAFAVHQLDGGGYIVAGQTHSFGEGNGDAWVMKIDESGKAIWQKSYGGSEIDLFYDIRPTGDSGFIAAGHTFSYSLGKNDLWLLKLDENGNIIWQKTLGGSEEEWARSVQVNEDGGCVVAGTTASFGAGSLDLWVVRLSQLGEVIWQKTYGDVGYDRGESLRLMSGGDLVLAGYITIEENSDVVVIRLNPQGDIVWQRRFGGGVEEIDYEKVYFFEMAYALCVNDNDDIFAAGETNSLGDNPMDALVMKLPPDGAMGKCELMKEASLVCLNSGAVIHLSGAVPLSTNAIIKDLEIDARSGLFRQRLICPTKKGKHKR
ncbi:MAG: hypothetical protein JXB26_02940 [Candidatus Aminicenantes bacterium]|nr:hypothetical protein [Candidatus Aminicenantes bacterium]